MTHQPAKLESVAPARFTAAEFGEMAGCGAFRSIRVELSNGELVRMNPPMLPHAQFQAMLVQSLGRANTDSSRLVVGEVGVTLSMETVRAFDAALVAPGDVSKRFLDPSNVVIGIEVSDETIAYDLGVKQQDYADAGIGEVWVVDVNAKVTHLMRAPVDGVYTDRGIVRFGEPIVSPLLAASVVIGTS